MYTGVCEGDGSSCVQPLVDCNGEVGGNAVLDACGVCEGDNSTCQAHLVDCNYVENGNAVLDACGVCDGDNSTCTDCAGEVNGNHSYDLCYVCDGDDSTCKDCLGNVNGSAIYDECYVCDGDNTSCQDCTGEVNGSAVVDDCGICEGTAITRDCIGEWSLSSCNARCGEGVYSRTWHTTSLATCGGEPCEQVDGYVENSTDICTANDKTCFCGLYEPEAALIDISGASVTQNNINGKGPNFNDKEELRLSNIGQTRKGTIIDLRIMAIECPYCLDNSNYIRDPKPMGIARHDTGKIHPDDDLFIINVPVGEEVSLEFCFVESGIYRVCMFYMCVYCGQCIVYLVFCIILYCVFILIFFQNLFF